MKHAQTVRAPRGRAHVAAPVAPPRPRPGGGSRPRIEPRPRLAPPRPGPAGSGVYPAPFGFVLSVPVAPKERLVPIAGSNASALAPVAGALALVRASGGFDVERVALPTAHARLTFFDVRDLARAKRRVAVLARDLLALAQSGVPARDRLGFRPALELRSSGASTLCLSVYGDGPVAPDEDTMLGLAQTMLGPLARVIEENASISTETVLRRRVRVCFRVAREELVAQLASRRRADPERERAAVREALDGFEATRASSALATAWNEIVLGPVADVARALGQNSQRTRAEGHRHACRFGSVAPLARFELDGRFLGGQLQLPCGLERHGRRHDVPSELAHRLLIGHSAEDVAEVAACVGLAAGLASLKAAVSLALSGAVPVRARPPSTAALDETRVMPLPPGLLDGPQRSPRRLRASAEETRVMALGEQRALARSMRSSEPRQPSAATRPRSAESSLRNSELRLRAPEPRGSSPSPRVIARGERH